MSKTKYALDELAKYASEHGVKAASIHFDCSTETVYRACLQC